MLYRSVPTDALSIIEINDLQDAINHINKSQYGNDIQQTDFAKRLINGYTLLDSLIFTPFNCNKHSSMLASMHPISVNNYDFLFLMPNNLLNNKLNNLIVKLKQQNIKISERTLSGCVIYEFNIPGLPLPFALASRGKLLMGSFSPQLLESSLYEFEKLWAGFAPPNNLSAKNFDLVMHLNPLQMSLFANIFVKSKVTFFNALHQNFSWISIGYSFENKEISTKISASINDLNNTLKTFLKQNVSSLPTQFEVAQKLPINTAFLSNFKCASITQFFKDLKLDKNPLEQFVTPWIGNEFAYGFIDPNTTQFQQNSFLAIQVTDTLKAKQTLTVMAGLGPQQLNQNHGHISNINSLNASIIAQALIGKENAIDFEKSFYAFISNILFIAPNANTLQVIIENYQKKNTLSNSSAFNNFIKSIPANSPIFTYIQPQNLKRLLLDASASTELSQTIDTKFEHYIKTSPICLQIEQNKQKLIANGVIGYLNNTPQKTIQKNNSQLIWSTQLSAAPIIPPQIINNLTTAEKEIFIQDKNYILFCLNKTGKILWQKQLDSKIIGKIQHIDYYKNNFRQTVFSTLHKLYTLNESGKDIDGSPIRFACENVSGLSSIDLDNNGKYCFFIGCNNQNIYAYEYGGKPLYGWSPLHLNINTLAFPLQHIQNKGVRQIIATNTQGTVCLINPKGNLNKRIACNTPIISAPQINLTQNNEAKIMVCNKQGNLVTILPNGNSSVKKPIPNAQSFTGYLLDNIIGSPTQEQIFLYDNKVSVFNQTQLLFSYTIPSKNKPTQVFTVNTTNTDTKKIGVFSEKDNEIYLLQNYGKIHQSFPLQASTPFILSDLFNSSEDILIAGGTQNNIFAYSIN